MERTYTVHRKADDTPYIIITGKWLKKRGFELGCKLKLIEEDGGFILMKIPSEISEQEKLKRKLKALEKEMNTVRQQLNIQGGLCS